MVTTKVSADKCCGCYACATFCPKNCIQMVADEDGFLHPICDESTCVNCNRCETVCPLLQSRKINDQPATEAFAVINPNESVRKSSSSGGVFTALAEEVLRRGGIVFGAAFAEDYKSVRHISVEAVDNLEKLRGSKYMQSEIGNAYALAKDYLDSGRMVLFSGTPCQIGGLNAYLGRKYDNLYTQDIICHGVPSSLLWKRYLAELEREASANVACAVFRGKDIGWKKYSVRIDFADGSEYTRVFFEDPFMQAFLADYCLRSSCFECAFKSIERQSDFTLGDYWGIEQELPEMDDDKGTSLVLIHSEKGKKLFDCVTHAMTKRCVDAEAAIKHNPSAICSAKRNPAAKKFVSAIRGGASVADAVKKAKHRSLWKRMVGRVKRILSQ